MSALRLSASLVDIHARAVKAEQEVETLRRELLAEKMRASRAEGASAQQTISLRVANERIAALKEENEQLRGECGDLRDEVDSLTAPQLSRAEELR